VSIGSYGIIRGADVSPEDVEILYHFVKDRNANSDVRLKTLDATSILTPVYHNSSTVGTSVSSYQPVADVEIIGGLYNLKLESSDFSDLGIYTLHLRPKQIRTKITDCGVLASLPSVRGLVIDLSNILSTDRNKFSPQSLIGYRIEYINPSDYKKIPNFYRVITSNFYCEPITTNLTNTNQKAIRYRYSDSATNLMFLTITPSAAPSTRPTTIPYIGQPEQTIILTNTYFNPQTIEIEMVEHDASTLANALYGNQSKAMESGIYTIYDKEKNIYKQFNLYEVKDEFNETLYEIREKREDVDESLNFDTITE
jgi:hypothetical protein